MALYEALTQEDLIAVGESYKQDMSSPAWNDMPTARIPDERAGIKGVKYRKAKLSTSLVDAALPDWKPGQTPPQPREIEYDEIEVAVDGKHTKPTTIASKTDLAHKIADLNNQGPLHLDQVYRQMEISLAAFLVDTTHNNAKAFTGGGALSAFGADNIPFKDIEDEIRTRKYRDYAGFTGLGLECIMDHDVARVLAGYEEYTHLIDSNGSGTRRAKSMDIDAFSAAFARKHGLDRVTIVRSIYNSAEEGATPAISKVFDGLFWIGIVDRSNSGVELSGSDTGQWGPGGGLALIASRSPELREWTDDGAEVQFVAGVASYRFVSPQFLADATKFGSKFTNAL